MVQPITTVGQALVVMPQVQCYWIIVHLRCTYSQSINVCTVVGLTTSL